MTIGILTYHCVPNFGAQLQALSTVHYVLRQGHIPIVLNWYPQDLENMYAMRVPSEQILIHKKFCQKYFPLSTLCRSEQELADAIKSYHIEGIIVGSDALFKYVPFSKRVLQFLKKGKANVLSVEKIRGNPFWGNFIHSYHIEAKASAFSVSSQNSPYRYMSNIERIIMKRALKSYKYISVRDEWTQAMIQYLNRDNIVPITPDPVFAFNQNCSDMIPSKSKILEKYNLNEDYVLFSFSSRFVNVGYIDSLMSTIESKGLQAVILPMPEGAYGNTISACVNIPLSPIDWYALIIHSMGFVGERMHPIVVCLHNSIPFFSFDEYGISNFDICKFRRNYIPDSSKIFSILKEADLLEYLYSYQRNSPLPLPSIVADKIMTFCKSKSTDFAERYLCKYNSAMNTLMSSIIE